MAPSSILLLGFFGFVLLVGSEAQKQYASSSYSQMSESSSNSQMSDTQTEETKTQEQPFRFNESPSVFDQFVDLEGRTIKLPDADTHYSYTMPGGNNKRVNNVLTVMSNYVAAGGYLTGVPPIDLLLLRLYLSMGPEKFC